MISPNMNKVKCGPGRAANPAGGGNTMKGKKFSLAVVLGVGLLISGTQAFARDHDRDDWRYGRDERHERRYDRDDRWRHDRDHRRDWDRDRDWRYRNYRRNGYYSVPYYTQPYYSQPYYYSDPYGPGVSGYFSFGR
jgi:hypothetical protein